MTTKLKLNLVAVPKIADTEDRTILPQDTRSFQVSSLQAGLVPGETPALQRPVFYLAIKPLMGPTADTLVALLSPPAARKIAHDLNQALKTYRDCLLTKTSDAPDRD